MSQSNQDAMKLAFENYSMSVLQAAVNYTADLEGVTETWVYTDMADAGIATWVFFRYNGAFLGSAEIAQYDRTGEMDARAFAEELSECGGREMLGAMLASGEPPYRLIISYNNVEGGMDAQFDYADTLGVDSTTSPTQLMDQWIISKGGRPIYS